VAASRQRDEGPPGGRSLVALSLSATLPCDACSTPRRLDGSPRARSLRNHFTVHFERGHRQERHHVAEAGPVLARDAVVFERNAADV
jgi:hypothetical protein